MVVVVGPPRTRTPGRSRLRRHRRPRGAAGRRDGRVVDGRVVVFDAGALARTCARRRGRRSRCRSRRNTRGTGEREGVRSMNDRVMAGASDPRGPRRRRARARAGDGRTALREDETRRRYRGDARDFLLGRGVREKRLDVSKSSRCARESANAPERGIPPRRLDAEVEGTPDASAQTPRAPLRARYDPGERLAARVVVSPRATSDTPRRKRSASNEHDARRRSVDRAKIVTPRFPRRVSTFARTPSRGARHACIVSS